MLVIRGNNIFPSTIEGLVREFPEVAEFAIVIRSDLKGRGLGSMLLKKIVTYCRARGTAKLVGQILPGNERMLALAHDCGFSRTAESGFDVVEVCRMLQEKQFQTREEGRTN